MRRGWAGRSRTRRRRRGARSWLAPLQALGPGLISGASDVDPTTVATLAVLGASTVYGLSWLALLIYPLLACIQMVSAQVGVAARQGLQAAVRTAYGRHWGAVLLLSVLAVNLITLSADLEAGAAALELLLGIPWQWLAPPFGLAMLSLLVFGSYSAVERFLRFVLLAFVAYVAAAFLARPDWGQILHDTVHPPISADPAYVEGMLALLGTTLTSYAYVWETIEEAEERPPLRELGLATADAGLGMLLAVAVFWFILIATGATLGVRHQPVETAQQAAQALRPAVGPLAEDLFALGLLASAVLAVPVLAASTAYVVAEEFGWRRGLSQRPSAARPFYAVLAGSMLLAVAVSLAGISPVRLLFASSIAGGLGTPISLAFLLRVARDRQVMADLTIGPLLATVGWATVILVGGVSLYFLWQRLA